MSDDQDGVLRKSRQRMDASGLGRCRHLDIGGWRESEAA